MKSLYRFCDNKLIINYSRNYCATPEELLHSDLFSEIVQRYIDLLEKKEAPLLLKLKNNVHKNNSAFAKELITFFQLLYIYPHQEIVALNTHQQLLKSSKEEIYQLIEDLYNYWRRLERYLILFTPSKSATLKTTIYQGQFIRNTEELKSMILLVYRTIQKNLTNEKFLVNRQLPSGANIGVLIEKISWATPPDYQALAKIPFIRMTVIDPPFIIYPRSNTRRGSFEEIDFNPVENVSLDKDHWFCYPALVGDMLIFIYFPVDFISLGLSLSNLFELYDLGTKKDVKPDAILVFAGPKQKNLKQGNVFYEDVKNDLFVGYLQHQDELDYFGYMKKMTLTLHNLKMMKRQRMPVHGAMVKIRFRDQKTISLLIIGDSGAGKSETLEALRVLAGDKITQMTVIFDDMGSIDQDLKAYGTEIGAFLRIDDLQAGYAFEEIDRSIFMNPHRANARIIIPVTRYLNIIAGEKIDYCFYANNYQEDGPIITIFSSEAEAYQVLRRGARKAKGTTDESGLVETYFANPFGPAQRWEEHDILAQTILKEMFRKQIPVGEIKTKLAITGMEQQGPLAAATSFLAWLEQ